MNHVQQRSDIRKMSAPLLRLLNTTFTFNLILYPTLPRILQPRRRKEFSAVRRWMIQKTFMEECLTVISTCNVEIKDFAFIHSNRLLLFNSTFLVLALKHFPRGIRDDRQMRKKEKKLDKTRLMRLWWVWGGCSVFLICEDLLLIFDSF